MARINHLLVKFNHSLIDKNYDFYILTTNGNYIKRGAYVLDKPVEKLKALSLAYESGKNAFIMFKKDSVSKGYLNNEIEDEITKIDKILSNEIKDYILFRLLLYSLNNYESDEMSFNNLAGKLFIYSPSWMSKKRKSFTALNVDVDIQMNLKAEATTFTCLSLFNEKVKKDYTVSKYEFASNNTLKRVLHYDNENNVFIRKPLYNSKAEIPFLDLSDSQKKTTKSYYLYYVTNLLKEKYDNLVELNYEEIEIIKSIDKIRDTYFLDKAISEIENKKINIINLLKEKEYSDVFLELKKYFTKVFSNVCISNELKKECLNIVCLHNKEYYSEKGYKDPYKNFKRDMVIQCVTYEDSINKIINNNEAIFNTIIKELAIKNEIINTSHFSIDNWENYQFEKDYIFGKEKDGVLYFMKISPSGDFTFFKKTDDDTKFKDNEIEECARVLSNHKGKEKVILSDCMSNIVLISRTNIYCIPNEAIFEEGNISRSKESRMNNLSGVLDINLFNYNNESYFNSGIIGYGMKYAIPKASLLYKTEIINGNNIFIDLLNTLSVSFVKYKSFTVLPYPFKYLNEYINNNQ